MPPSAAAPSPASPMTPSTTTTAARSAAATAAAAATRTAALSAAAATGPIRAPGIPPRGWLRFRRPPLRRLAARACRGRHPVSCAGDCGVAPGIPHAGGPRRWRGDLNHASRTGPAQQRPLRDSQPRADAHHRGRSGEAVLEYQTAPRAAAPALRAVDKQTAAVVARTAIDDEPAGVDERPVVRPVEERIVEDRSAKEQVLKERIVARTVAAVAIVGPPAIAVAEAHPHAERRVVVIIARVVRIHARDGVVRHVVVEVAVGRHALRDVEQRLLLVVPGLARRQHTVVPVIAAHELVELERRRGTGREHQPRAVRVVDVEGLAVTAAAQLDGAAAAHEVVVRGIEREQHPHATPSVAPQHYDVAVLGRADLYARPVAALEVVVLIERNLDRWVVTAYRLRRPLRRRRSE